MASNFSSFILIVLVSLGLAQAQFIFPPPFRFPGAPIPGVPGIPGLPIPGIPGVPIPRIPGVPFPGIPRIPGLPVPGTPGSQIPTIPGVPIPGIPSGPPELQECWASILNIGGCYAEVFRALQSGQAGFTVGSTCCKAVKDLSSTCWPRMFPVNPLFPPQLQNYCSRYTNNPLPVVPAPTYVPIPPVAPAPKEDSPESPAPEGDSPVAPAPEDDALAWETSV